MTSFVVQAADATGAVDATGAIDAAASSMTSFVVQAADATGAVDATGAIDAAGAIDFESWATASSMTSFAPGCPTCRAVELPIPQGRKCWPSQGVDVSRAGPQRIFHDFLAAGAADAADAADAAGSPMLPGLQMPPGLPGRRCRAGVADVAGPPMPSGLPMRPGLPIPPGSPMLTKSG